MTEPARGLTAEQILAAQDFRIQAVEVPEWGGTLYVRSLPMKHMKVFTELSAGAAKGEFTYPDIAKLTALTICDAQGNLIFTEDDTAKLLEKDFNVVNRVFLAAVHAIGLTKEAVEAEKKDSETAPSPDSNSESPAASDEHSENSEPA